jgi:hypothetical protein
MDQTAAPELAHLPPEVLGAEKIAGQVDGQDRVPLGKRQSVEPAGPQHRGGVDQNTARSQRFLDRLGCRGDALGIRGVASCHDMAAAQFAQSPFRARAAFLPLLHL